MALALAGSLVASQAGAVSNCAGERDELAMKTAAVQQALMVAALSCSDVGLYNRFVVNHQGALQRSDHELMAFFERENGEGGAAEYHAFKTKAANVSALEAARNHDNYCNNAGRLFEAGLPAEVDLAAFVTEQWGATNEYIRTSCTVDTRSHGRGWWRPAYHENTVPDSPADPSLGSGD